MDTLLVELRHAARRLRATPGLTLLMVATLALGLGAATAIFSFADTVLFRPLPFHEPERLVRVYGTIAATDEDRAAISFPDYFDWVEQSQAFDHIAGFVRWNYNLASDGRPQRVWGSMVTGNIFDTMGASPVVGRGFTLEEDRPGGDKVVVIGHALWQTLYAGDPGAVGRSIRLDDADHRIVGVMGPGFEYPTDAQLWTPFGFDRNSFPRQIRPMRIVARLASGVSLESAKSDTTGIFARLEEQYPQSNTGRGARLEALQDDGVADLRLPLLVLLGASLLVLLLACINVSNLLIARAIERHGEMSVRRALGASLRRLWLQFSCEGLLLAVMGGLVGLVFAYLGIRALVSLSLAQQQVSFLADRLHDIPRLLEVGLDLRVLAFSFLLIVATVLLVSSFPIFFVSDRGLTRAMEGSRRGAIGQRGGHRTRQFLVIAEVAVAVTLLFNAGLLVRSFAALQEVDLGFRPNRVSTLQIALPQSTYPGAQQTQSFYGDLLRRVQALPGVRLAGLTWGLPLSDVRATISFAIDRRPPLDPSEDWSAGLQPISADYFRTIGTPLVAGRFFSEGDDAQSPPVVLVNQTLAGKFFPGENPVGETITFGANLGPLGMIPTISRRIVGVVGDVRNVSLAEAPRAEVYVPFQQNTWRMMTLVVQTESDPTAIGADLQRQVWALNDGLGVYQQQSLEEMVAQATSQAKLTTVLLLVFAGAALLLAAVGIFGVLSQSVQTRTRELGIRLTLGGDRSDLLKQVMARGLTFAAIGIVVGTVTGFLCARLLRALFFGTTATDPQVLLAGILITAMTTLGATYLPARQATRIEPMVALRTE